MDELREVLTYLEQLREVKKSHFEWEVDLEIIRGLDYYTGTIFEAVFKNDSGLGSIC
ncbi:ATP phosphoribosyltransferase regulatory subunit [bacterium]|nr:ATP phosphoribosyltransferase regulatory subunit [bacterium]